jgi:hypothetical protein
MVCPEAPCRTLGFDGRVQVRRNGNAREITWQYSDAGSAHPRGIQIIQRSFDGLNGADYVLYVFRITNGGTQLLTFTPGLFFDFDVTPELFNNLGYTDLNGRLMVTRTLSGQGRYLGTAILEPTGSPRNFFFDGVVTAQEMVSALRGTLRNTSTGPTDVHGVHGGPTVSLGAGRSKNFWVAIVAGESRAEIRANAQAALADAQTRRNNPNLFAGGAELVKVNSRREPGRASEASMRGLCKTGCRAPK